MQMREKALLCAAPFVVAAYLWFSLTSPALVAGQDKDTELAEKRREQIELKTKLFDMARLERERKTLEQDIEQLRGSVPKKPDIDIFLIDLEKMCEAAGLDIVRMEPPERDKLRELEAPPPEDVTAAAAATSKLGLGAKTQEKTQVGKPTAKTPEVETGLSKLVMDVQVTGNYPDFIKLMNLLEGYERVIGISQVKVEYPADIQEKKIEHHKELIISFLMTAYYLP